ncbi:MAG: hypothetical protein HYS62_01940 [Candidatus Aenigmarchaeota archaeon]|nr:hypothetical protein [Candidatus Aenigmarchaeota archaeon]
MKKTRKIGDVFGFWKFLIVLSIMLNVVNFYFISGLYTGINSNDSNVPLSSTAGGGMTGYFVLGSSSFISLILLIAVVSAYLVFRKRTV